MQQVTISIREVLLEEIQAQQPKSQIDASLSQISVLNAAAKRFGTGNDEAILTQWGELFRTGLLAWGLNLSNPNPPLFHLTDRGRRALAHLTRDPSNADGYMRHLASLAKVNDVAMSYLKEGLDCYVAGHYKAAAVMVGGAAESVILDLRDQTVVKLKALGKTPSKQIEDWRIKTVTDEPGNSSISTSRRLIRNCATRSTPIGPPLRFRFARCEMTLAIRQASIR